MPRLRANDVPSRPIALSPDVIRAIPALPLTTQFGDLNIVLRPIGAPAEYEEVLDDASTVELDTVPTLVPTVEALLRGLAGGVRQPHPQLLARLRNLTPGNPPPAVRVILPPLTEAEQRVDLEKAIIETLDRLGTPASIRDLLFAMKADRRPPYKQVKLAAEALTGRGRLRRDKEGTAYRYWPNTAADQQIARDIATLLAEAIDAEATAAQALRLVAADSSPRSNDGESARKAPNSSAPAAPKPPNASTPMPPPCTME